METRIERELKLESKHPIDLDLLGGEPLEHRSFISTYHDTPDRLLAQCGITLRRRLENGRNEWQLKLPADGDRREVEALGAPAAPPPEIMGVLMALLHGRELVPLATLRTARQGVLVRTDAGAAEVVSDDVAVLEGQRVTEEFGEVEIELVDGSGRALRSIERAVKHLGARRSDGRTKIARALRESDSRAAPAQTDAERLREYFHRCYVELLAADAGVRLGADTEPVHDLRVSVRRLRAVLRAGHDMFVPEWADRLRDELGWLGRAFGPLRDLDVLSAHLAAESATLDERDRAPLAGVFAMLEADRTAARAEALAVLESDRYFALLAALPSAPHSAESKRTLAAVGAAQLKKLTKLMRDIDADAPDELVHKARIRGKRLRYVAEVLDEGRVVSRAKEFQDVVGDHQDAVVADEELRALAKRVPAAALTLGMLLGRERDRRLRARDDLPKAWKRLRRSAKRAWA